MIETCHLEFVMRVYTWTSSHTIHARISTEIKAHLSNFILFHRDTLMRFISLSDKTLKDYFTETDTRGQVSK